jgi:hypothetical protein
MNPKNLWTAVLSGAVLTTLVSNLPYIGLVNILCFAGFWASAIFTVWLYRRLGGTPTVGEAVRIGLLTGLFAGLLGFVLSFFNLAGLQGMSRDIQQLIPADADPGDMDIPAWGVLVFNLIGVLVNILFGIIGGWIGGVLFRTDRQSSKS